MSKFLRITHISQDGSAFAEDGREFQLVVDPRTNALGVIKREAKDVIGALDQTSPVDIKAHFDLSGLDQY